MRGRWLVKKPDARVSFWRGMNLRKCVGILPAERRILRRGLAGEGGRATRRGSSFGRDAHPARDTPPPLLHGF